VGAADTRSVTRSRAALCVVCPRLVEERKLLILEYQMAADALAGTPRSDPVYAARWLRLSDASERLDDAEQILEMRQTRHRVA
jgi:hypothetical protein